MYNVQSKQTYQITFGCKKQYDDDDKPLEMGDVGSNSKLSFFKKCNYSV